MIGMGSARASGLIDVKLGLFSWFVDIPFISNEFR